MRFVSFEDAGHFDCYGWRLHRDQVSCRVEEGEIDILFLLALHWQVIEFCFLDF